MNKLTHLLGLSIPKIKTSSMYKSLTIGELQSLETLEMSGKNRKTIIKHINSRINSFNKKPTNSIVEKTLKESDIEFFYNHQIKSCNDECNKTREYIIKTLADGNPYPDNHQWIKLHDKYNLFIDKLKSQVSNTHQPVCDYKIKTKGGRRYHYDFIIMFYNASNTLIKEYKIEFKNNACNVNDCPQYVSPMKLSKYFECEKTYEELFYDEYLQSICSQVNHNIPDKTIYLKQIHGNNPKCMIPVKESYYKGAKQSSKYTGLEEDIKNYNFMKEKSKESIKKFLEGSQLKISEMNKYLIDSQKDKKYMLWGNNEFHYQEVDSDDYTIEKVLMIKKNHTVVCLTKSNKEMNILLRWKNGNGVAFPALQIS
tara:strand:+ start:190 stop:1293 length:1104 start_codon:yes stop_codon:yes gene_type:complete